MRYIVDLTHAGPALDVHAVGGKALKLGEMVRAGFAVPEGFVVTTAAFEAGMTQEVRRAITEAYEGLIGEGGGRVAVRSSGTLEDSAQGSMAGQFETYLHRETLEEVLEGVEKCWKSAGAERVEAYLRQAGRSAQELKMAVVVQQMVEAEVAGVMFTENPMAGQGEMVIDASWGVGEAVVSGKADPDHVVVERATGRVVSQREGKKEVRVTREGEVAERREGICLTEGKVRALWELGRRVEAVFGQRQDVEWAFDREGKLWCLQVRAIATPGGDAARSGEEVETTRQEERDKDVLLREIQAALEETLKRRPGAAWARHNLGETLVHPTPLTWTALQLDSAESALARLNVLAGYRRDAAAVPLVRIGGRIYIDLERAPSSLFEGMPFRYDVERLRRHPEEAQMPPTVPVGGVRTRMRGNRHIRNVRAALAEKGRTLAEEMDREHFPKFRAWGWEARGVDLTRLHAEGWIELWRARQTRVAGFAALCLLPTMIFGMAMGELQTFLVEHFWDEEPELLAATLAVSEAADATLRQNVALYELAHGRLTLDRFMDDFGHRGVGELELTMPRWREVPGLVTAAAAGLKSGANPAEIHAAQHRAALETQERLAKQLGKKNGQQLSQQVALVRTYRRFREDGKHEWMRGHELLRVMLLDAARRLETPAADLAMLEEGELFEAVRSERLPMRKMAEVKARRALEAGLILPEVMAAEDVKKLGAGDFGNTGGENLAAYGLSPGKARGCVRVVLSPGAAGDLEAGYVLVCPSTDPNWTPLFVNAAAIILERGGMLSHGAVVAREMGKPAVVLAGATRILKDGDEVEVDARAARVVRVSDVGESKGAPNAAEQDRGADATDASDDRIAARLMPPPAGCRERLSAKMTWAGFAVWGAFLLVMWLAPGLGMWEWAMGLLDQLLWPLVRACGRQGAVMILAAALAFGTMVAQLLLTDARRLREVKRRARTLRKMGHALPLHSPRENAIHAVVTAAQQRVALSGLVPLGILLGPMVLSFMWLPERVDLARQNPTPGSKVDVTAWVDGEYSGEVRLENSRGLVEPRVASTARLELVDIERQLAGNESLSPVLTSWLATNGKTRQSAKEELTRFLTGRMPDQAMVWRNVELPAAARKEVLRLRKGLETLSVEMGLGDAEPPPLKIMQQPNAVTFELPGGNDVKRVTITMAAPHGRSPFWEPLGWMGVKWDAGWLGLYLVMYLPVMYVSRRVLRVA